MADFDISLIREFESRPGFYDRDCPHFKDKLYNAQAWQDISNTLGYDVALLKDRMLQLRNRYNLEKRRLENLSIENPGTNVQSPWPLYEHLQFLSTHIRARRTYKRMMTSLSTEQPLGTNVCSSTTTSSSYANGMLAVKLENETDGDGSESFDDKVVEVQERSHIDDPDLILQPEIRDQTTTSELNSMVLQSPAQKTISIKNIDSLRTIVPKSNLQKNNDELLSSEIPKKRRRLEMRLQKYDAFGKFMSTSLVEMQPTKALSLVEKFTSDLVKKLIEKNHSNKELPITEAQLVDIPDGNVH